MPMHKHVLSVAALLALAFAARAETQGRYGIGRSATEAEIAGWNIDVGRDGSNLPPGSGTVAHGREVFEQQCAACHGGSYWPYAPTLFDYIRRAMPQNAPQSLGNEDVYAVAAYILNMNGLLPADATLDAKSLSAIKMPNRRMFVGDPRPDVKNPACEKDC
jgi:mono/diheme cytochrome c family protein